MEKILLIIILSACIQTPAPVEPVQPKPIKKKCEIVSEVIKRAQGDSLQMPVIGSIAHESHYLVKGLDPEKVSSGTDRVASHMTRTCLLLRGAWAKYFPGLSANCKEVYQGGGATQWTPAEPVIGRGVADYFPSVECEAAIGTMYWGKGQRPPYGTRFIAMKDKKAFVLCMGYEAGPGSKERIGGLGTEALYYLGGKHGSTIMLARAKDQTLSYGPIDCEQ